MVTAVFLSLDFTGSNPGIRQVQSAMATALKFSHAQLYNRAQATHQRLLDLIVQHRKDVTLLLNYSTCH